MANRVVLVGLGSISSAHLRALEDIEPVELVVGVDPNLPPEASFRGEPLRVYRRLGDALAEGADLVVVATPTGSHASVVKAVRARNAVVPILVEKPAADRRADAEQVLGADAAQVIFHAGFAPEVLWAVELRESARTRLGDVVAFEAFFASPYADDRKSRTASLANSWLDSGINVLSIVGRFAVPSRVLSFRSFADRFSTFAACFGLGARDAGNQATIVTTWQAASFSQWSRLCFSEGTEIVFDHIAGAATAISRGAVTEIFTRADAGPRLAGHYANFYRDYLGARRRQYADELGRDLHGLLFAALAQLS